MSRLQWDKTGEHFYESGVDRVVLYVLRSVAAWNGITAINESPSGAELSKIYADNEIYGVVMSPEEDALTIEAFTYPELFARCVGRTQLIPGVYVGQQNRSSFGLCWRTNVYDERGDVGYKIHIAPFLFASSSEDSNSTVNDSPEQKTYSWNATALPVAINERISTSMIVLDSRWYNKNGLWNALLEIEDVLYGSDNTTARLITFTEIESIVNRSSMLLDDSGNFILDSDDGTIQTVTYKE